MLVANMDGKESVLQHYNQKEANNYIETCKAQDGSMKNQIEVLRDNTKDWSRIIETSLIKHHL